LISPVTKLTTVKEGLFYALLDGGNGFCIVAAYRATRIAIEKARNVGLGFVGVRNLGHVGMLAYYTKMVAREGMIGFACANGPARVATWGGAEAVFGTNPISYAFPLEGAEPIVFDAATSAIASFKIRLAAMRSEKIPEGVALDKDGRPTTDPEKALQGVLLPFGGYKGYAFSLLVELLTHAVVGALPSTEIPSHASTQGGFLVVALSPAIFRSYEEYIRDVSNLVKRIKGVKTAEEFREVLLPGELEERTFRERLEKGIPLEEKEVEELRRVAKKLGIEPPKPMTTET